MSDGLFEVDEVDEGSPEVTKMTSGRAAFEQWYRQAAALEPDDAAWNGLGPDFQKNWHAIAKAAIDADN